MAYVWALVGLLAFVAYVGLVAWLAGVRHRQRMRARDGKRAARQLRWHRGEEPMPFTWYDTYREHWEFVQDHERLCQPLPLGLGFRMAIQPEQVPGGTRVTYTREVADAGELQSRRAVPAS